MAKRPKWLEDALEEYGTQIVEEDLGEEEVAELTGFSPRKVRLLMKELNELAEEEEDEEEDEEVEAAADDDDEEEVVDEDDDEEEEEEAPAPKRRKDKQGKARGGVKAKAIEEEEDPEDTEGPAPAQKPKRGAKTKAAKELPEDPLERLRVMYRRSVNGEEDLAEQLNEEAEQRLRSVVDYDFDNILDGVTVIDAGAKWMTIRLHLAPTDLPKGRSADEKKREKLVRSFLKEVRPALEESDGQAKIFKKNLVLDEDGNGTVDFQIRIR